MKLISAFAVAVVATALGCSGPPQTPPPVEVPESPQCERGDLDGETCASALPICVAVEDGGGTTVGAVDDLEASCTGRGAPERVYRVTLDEPAGLSARAEGVEYDVGLYVMRGSCGGADQIPGACSDAMMNQLAIEEVKIPLLEPGDYFVVVEGYGLPGGSAFGEFSLDVVIYPGGSCFGDSFDENAGDGSAATATFTGAGDIDTADLGDPSTPGTDYLPFTLCEANDDFFSFGHMGGELDVSTAVTFGDGVVTGEVFHAIPDPAKLAEGTFELTLGDKLADTDFSGPAPRGYYLLKVSGRDVGQIGTDYSIAIAHACEPDELDDADAELDDGSYATAQVALLEPLTRPIERSVCESDKDTFVLDNVLAGDVVVTLADASTLNVDVSVVDRSAAAPNVAPYAAFETAVSGSDLIVTLPAAPAGRYVLTVDGGELPSTVAVPYEVNATFAGVAAAPGNDGCAGAESLVPSAMSPATLYGRTVTGSDDLAGPCNGDNERSAAGRGAPEVFYTLTLSETSDLAVDFDGSPTGFTGSLYLLAYPASCPASLDDLVPVEADMGPVCDVGQSFALRVRAVPAGDYLVVVDGAYRAQVETMMGPIPEVKTRGAFNLTATLYPDGLPPLDSCVNAETLAVPSPGSATTATFDNSALQNEITTYGSCSDGGRGREKIFTLTPAADVDVTIAANGYDTVVSIREADCEFGTQTACNDDVDFQAGDYSSRVTGTLRADTTYFLVVDAWSPDQIGTASVTITAQ